MWEFPFQRVELLQSGPKQGVLLLNAVLTVEDGRAAAHQGQGLGRVHGQNHSRLE